MKTFSRLIAMVAGTGLAYSVVGADAAATANPKLRMTTSAGVIEIELDARRAPLSTENFLKYVDQGTYNGTIFHRVIPGFMIQGGGFAPGMKQKPTAAPIQNEADNGLKNTAGTLAMARTGDPHSATAQFFINTVTNPFLDHKEKSPQGWGYAVFGKVTSGMDIVKKIEGVATGNNGGHQNVPRQDVVIQKIERVKTAKP